MMCRLTAHEGPDLGEGAVRADDEVGVHGGAVGEVQSAGAVGRAGDGLQTASTPQRHGDSAAAVRSSVTMPADAAPCTTGGRVTCVQSQEIITCGGTYGTATDANGVRIAWTYSNGSARCITVRYDMSPNAGSCRFFFYVPNGYATANVIFGYWDTAGRKYYASLNEANVEGWVEVFQASNIGRIEFGDNNGQPVGATQIGWGYYIDHGFKRQC